MPISHLKNWTPIIASLLAFAGMIFVALIQSSGATKSDVNTIVKVMNENVIPAIQKTLDTVDSKLDKECLDRAEEISKLKERIAFLEGKFGVQSSSFNPDTIKNSIAKIITPTALFNKKEAREKLPMLQETK
jgi:hypothetical protein